MLISERDAADCQYHSSMRAFLFGFILAIFLTGAPAKAQLVADIIDAPASLRESDTRVVGKRATVTITSNPIFTAFTGLAFELFSDAEELEGRVRIDESSVWSEWIPLHFVRSATHGFFIAGFYGDEVWSSTRFQIEVSGPSEAPVTFGSAGVFDNRQDEDQRPYQRIEQRQKEGRAEFDGQITPPVLITRNEWGADPFVLGSPVPLANPTYDFMTFHHAAGFSATTYDEGLLQVKAIQDLHQNVRGWSDIGYQFVVDRSGRVYQGRPFLDSSTTLAQEPVLARGAHVGGHNTGNIGICMLGCYHPPEGSYCQEVPTEESLLTFVTMFAFLSDRYGPEVASIFGHRDWSSTACPGDNNYIRLPSVRADVATMLITGNQAVATATLEAEADESGIIQVSWEFLEDFGVDSYRLERTYGGTTEIVHTGLGAESTSFSDADITDLGKVTYSLYAHASDGRIQRVGTVELTLNFPESFSLSEPFPNPVHTQATLRYFLPYEAFVKIILYDSAGREIKTLTDRFQQGDQWYVSLLNVSDLASGMYYYRIRIDGFSGIAFDETRTIAVMN